MSEEFDVEAMDRKSEHTFTDFMICPYWSKRTIIRYDTEQKGEPNDD